MKNVHPIPTPLPSGNEPGPTHGDAVRRRALAKHALGDRRDAAAAGRHSPTTGIEAARPEVYAGIRQEDVATLPPLRLDRLLYPVGEVERLLSMSHSTLYRRIAAGELDARRIGGRTVITADSIGRFVAALPKIN